MGQHDGPIESDEPLLKGIQATEYIVLASVLGFLPD